MTIRVAVLGLGFGQAVHVPAFRAAGAEVVAIAGSTAERAKAVAERLRIPRAVGGWRELVDDPMIDALSIALPPAVQAEVVVAAAATGKHVFCEKPAAVTVAQAEAMV